MGRGPTVRYHKNMMEGYVKGTLTCLKAKYIKDEINTDFPLVLNIEPTNDCNLQCSVCPRSKSSRKVGYMDFRLFKKIINEAVNYKQLTMLNLHKDGEPLLHKDLSKMISYAKKKRVARTIHMNTNGLLLAGKKINEIINSGIDDITISVDAYSPEIFYELKGKDLLHKVEDNIIDFLRKRIKGSHPWVRVKIMEFDRTKNEIGPFIKKWKKVVDEVQVTGVHNWSKAVDITPTDEVAFIKNKKRFPCIFLWYMLAINWSGEAGLCSVDWNNSYIAGNANRQLLHNIWNSQAMKKVRSAHLDGRYDYALACKDCIVWGGGNNLRSYFIKKRGFYL